MLKKRESYKQTEIGIIPEDWAVKRLSDLASIKGGKRLPKGYFLTQKPNSHPYIRVSDMKHGSINLDNVLYVPDSTFPLIKNYLIYKEDIFISVAGTLGIVGKIPLQLDGANLTENADRICEIKIDRDYLLHYLMFDKIQKLIDSIKTVGAQPKLDLCRVEKFLIPVPSLLNEQLAIAEVLSDVDKLIESLKQLISKKQGIKTATMQQLFTGKKRLPGFSEEWKKKKLGDICDIRKGDLITEFSSRDGEIPVIAGGINTSYNHNVSNRKANTITISASGVSAGYVGFHKKPIFASDCSTIEETDRGNIVYLFYMLKNTQADIYRLQVGGAQPHVYPECLKAFEILYSSDVNEQIAIAEILSNMDEEIKAREIYLAKVCMLKQGMMQELLTGKTRLIDVKINANNEVRNQHFTDAVIISVLTDQFGSEQYPLGRMRCTKLSYLFHRYKSNDTSHYLKKAAGPYNPKTRYGGAEKIALERKYIRDHKNGKLNGFISHSNITEPKEYFIKWYGNDAIEWLEQFKYVSNDQLELWATIDMAIENLNAQNTPVTLENLKSFLKSNEEWQAKLERDIFSDRNIQSAILKSQELFGSTT